ncbi:MAG TPA: hypothetical protein VEC76_16715 [Streptosporangiaceae bacterium]|nr:hypothetical protein [Streptosporangiaceae bacterium]
MAGQPELAAQGLPAWRVRAHTAATVTAGLEREGVRSFCDSYHQLLACIEHKLGQQPGFTPRE